MARAYYQHPALGWLELTTTPTGLQSLYFRDQAPTLTAEEGSDPLLTACKEQLAAYFQGTSQTFDLPLDLSTGTPFQRQVWQQLLTIPYGQTLSYLDLARALDNEKGIRAVGQANGRNPISLIVPCHRVIGHNGKLTGYGGGLWRKQWLLNHEQARRPLIGS